MDGLKWSIDLLSNILENILLDNVLVSCLIFPPLIQEEHETVYQTT